MAGVNGWPKQGHRQAIFPLLLQSNHNALPLQTQVFTSLLSPSPHPDAKLTFSCIHSQEAEKGAQAGTLKSGKLVPEPPIKDTRAISPTPHGGVAGRIRMSRKRSRGERDLVQMHASHSTSEGEIRAPRSLADFGAILGVPRACLKKKWG